MTLASDTPPYPNVMRAAAVCLTIFVLWVAQDLFIPCTIAALISFVFAPVIRLLRRMGVHNAVASSIVTLALTLIGIGLIFLTSSQMLDLTRKLPGYRDNLVQRIRSIKSSTDHSLNDLHQTVADLQHELETTTAPTTPAVAPVPVQLVTDGSDWWGNFTDYISPAIKPLTQCSVILLLVFFITLSFDQIVNKGRRMARRLDLYQASEAVDEASVTLGRYLRAQLLVNMAYGAAIGTTMLLFGLPNSLMWGILAALLRYLPYVGPTIAVLLPTLLAIAIAPNWSMPLYFLSCLIVIEIIVNVLLEPMFYGHSTGVSSLGVIVSTLFWGWLWGAPGLLLAMPITACLVVVGRHVRPLLTIADLLGSEDGERVEAPVSPEPIRIAPPKVETQPS